MPVDSEEPCHPEACKIQLRRLVPTSARPPAFLPLTLDPARRNCLMNRGYDDSKCAQQISALYLCCQQFYKRNGDDARCAACPRPDLLRRKLDERGLGEQST
ncbi:hypothetical protein JCM8208_004788 [Rhodotorula glutinis]